MTPVEITAAWISGAFTLGAAAIAFGPLTFQMWWQGRQNRAANLGARRQAFNESLYRDGIAAARRLSNAAGSYMTQLYVAQQQIHLAILSHETTGQIRPPSFRYLDLLALDRACSDALTDLVFLIEERLIADHRLSVFKLAFLAKAHDVREAFGANIQWNLMQSLQHQFPDGTLSVYETPSQQAFEQLQFSIAALADPLIDCGAFCEDLIVELQNAHLGEVFDTKLAHREPEDPSRIVLRLDKYEELMAWVETTPWEQKNREIEAQARSTAIAG